MSGQAFAFTFSKLCFGVASDSISPVYLLVGGLLINALMILLLGNSYMFRCTYVFIGFATSFYQILVIMFVIGAVQGGGWVPSTRLVNKVCFIYIYIILYNIYSGSRVLLSVQCSLFLVVEAVWQVFYCPPSIGSIGDRFQQLLVC